VIHAIWVIREPEKSGMRYFKVQMIAQLESERDLQQYRAIFFVLTIKSFNKSNYLNNELILAKLVSINR